MATKIFNTTTKETVELEVISDGQDFLADVIGGLGIYDNDVDDADFAMDDDDLAWWKVWAEREQRILDKANELGEEAIQAISELAEQYGHDMDVLQDREEEYLGIA